MLLIGTLKAQIQKWRILLLNNTRSNIVFETHLGESVSYQGFCRQSLSNGQIVFSSKNGQE